MWGGGTGFPNAKGLSADGVQGKARSLHLRSAPCREMRADPGTRPEKAASGVEGDPVPATGTKASEWTGISRDCLRWASGGHRPREVGDGAAPGNQRLPPAGSGAGVPGGTPRRGRGDPRVTLRQQRAERQMQTLVKIRQWSAEPAEAKLALQCRGAGAVPPPSTPPGRATSPAQAHPRGRGGKQRQRPGTQGSGIRGIPLAAGAPPPPPQESPRPRVQERPVPAGGRAAPRRTVPGSAAAPAAPGALPPASRRAASDALTPTKSRPLLPTGLYF